MARYRQVDPRIWGDEGFLKLAEGEKLLVLYILTSPQTNRIGCFRFSPGMAAEDLGCTVATLSGRLETVCQTLSWTFASEVRLLFIPTWMRYQPPANPNQLQSWAGDYHELPDHHLKALCYQSLAEASERWSERFLEWFGKPTSNGMPNQEQEQEQEQEPPCSPPKGGSKTVRGEIEWRIEQAWSAHLKQREGFFAKTNGAIQPAPALTKAIRDHIREALHRHDADLLGADDRDRWMELSRVRAAGVGIFLDRWMTGQHRDNNVAEGGRRYLEPDRPWKVPRGKPDPVPRFADRYFEVIARRTDP